MERQDELASRAGAARAASGPYIAGPYLDWAAVIGGAVVASAIGGVFTSFGTALGLSTISAEPGEGSVTAWMIVTALWLVVTLVTSYLAGGYIAGRMRRRVDDPSSDEVAARDAINGLVVWALGMLVTAWMVASAIGTAATAAGNAAGGVARAAGSVLQAGAETAAVALSGPGDQPLLDWTVDTLMRPAEPFAGSAAGDAASAAAAGEGDELRRQSGSILMNVLRTGEISDADRGYLAAVTARQSGMTDSDAQARVDAAIENVQKMRADAEQAAVDAAETARVSTILTTFLLTAAALVAAVAATAGAVRGGHHRDQGRLFGGFSYRL